jgi:hypothetical protein
LSINLSADSAPPHCNIDGVLAAFGGRRGMEPGRAHAKKHPPAAHDGLARLLGKMGETTARGFQHLRRGREVNPTRRERTAVDWLRQKTAFTRSGRGASLPLRHGEDGAHVNSEDLSQPLFTRTASMPAIAVVAGGSVGGSRRAGPIVQPSVSQGGIGREAVNYET